MTPPRWLSRWLRRPAPVPDCGGLSCREMVELITDYLEGALPPDTRARFEQHIAACGDCTRYMVQMRETLQVVGHIDPEALDPRVEAELLDAFRDWKNAPGA
jgi:anti-sigma factor RsiW